MRLLFLAIPESLFFGGPVPKGLLCSFGGHMFSGFFVAPVALGVFTFEGRNRHLFQLLWTLVREAFPSVSADYML